MAVIYRVTYQSLNQFPYFSVHFSNRESAERFIKLNPVSGSDAPPALEEVRVFDECGENYEST